jgi:hypothetical protein
VRRSPGVEVSGEARVGDGFDALGQFGIVGQEQPAGSSPPGGPPRLLYVLIDIRCAPWSSGLGQTPPAIGWLLLSLPSRALRCGLGGVPEGREVGSPFVGVPTTLLRGEAAGAGEAVVMEVRVRQPRMV